jgi:acetyl-CoA C-acetyltransferase
MTRASLKAGADAGSLDLLAAVDRIAVPQGSWAYANPARSVAEQIGAKEAVTIYSELGVPQQTLINEALRAITAGESDVALVVGGEARAWARTPGATETARPDDRPDRTEAREPDFFEESELAAGIVVPPVQQYAIIENALAQAEGQTPAEHVASISALWARFNLVAQKNPRAAFSKPRSAIEISTPGPDNRPMAYPYNKWHMSQWTVDQAAALLLCSEEAARRFGVSTDQWVFPLVGLDANHAISLSQRRLLHRWPAMAVLGQAAAERLGRPLRDVEITEVYSCFPAAVRVQQRELGLDLDGTPTVTGGMAFAGGPFNNFVLQSTVAVVEQLRRDPAAQGLVTTVCGMLTKPGLGVWSATPDGRTPLLDDLGEQAALATPVAAVASDYRGPATVASFSVTYDDGLAVRTAVVADTADRRRCSAQMFNVDVAREAVSNGMVGHTIHVEGSAFTI